MKKNDENSTSDSVESLHEPFGSGGSEADPNYSEDDSSTSSFTTESSESITLTKRKRKNNKGMWKKNEAKRLRNSGLSYKSLKVITRKDGSKERKPVTRDAKRLLPPCNEKCRLQCSKKITEERRRKIFRYYWQMAELLRHRDFIVASMESIIPKYRYDKPGSLRRHNNAFYLDSGGEKVRVCKHFFIATVGINSRAIRTVTEKQDSLTKGILETEMRGKHNNHATLPEDIKESVRNLIKQILSFFFNYYFLQRPLGYLALVFTSPTHLGVGVFARLH